MTKSYLRKLLKFLRIFENYHIGVTKYVRAKNWTLHTGWPAGQERNNKDYNNEVNNIRVMICLFRKDTCTNYYRRYEQLIGQTTIVNNVRVMKCLFRKDTCTNEYRRSEQLI